jgi:hypothetical protein
MKGSTWGRLSSLPAHHTIRLATGGLKAILHQATVPKGLCCLPLLLLSRPAGRPAYPLPRPVLPLSLSLLHPVLCAGLHPVLMPPSVAAVFSAGLRLAFSLSLLLLPPLVGHPALLAGLRPVLPLLRLAFRYSALRYRQGLARFSGLARFAGLAGLLLTGV